MAALAVGKCFPPRDDVLFAIVVTRKLDQDRVVPVVLSGEGGVG